MYRQAILQILPKWHFWNNRVCFSHVRLKENFQKTLEVIKESHRALKFCGILINAKEITQESDCISLHPSLDVTLNKDELAAHSIICELKEIIHKDKPDFILIDTILKALKNSSNETRQQLISLLFSIDAVNFLNPKGQSLKEYLKYFISDVECFFRNANKKIPNLFLDTQGALKMVEARLFDHLGQNMLNDGYMSSIFYLYSIVSDVIFEEGNHSDDHNREIEVLMSDAVSLISTRLLLLNSASKSIIEKHLLARRSSLAIDGDDINCEEFYLQEFRDCYYFLDMVPFYYMSRKERLLQHLKDTKSSNNAWEFCELLRSINKLNSDTDINKIYLNDVLLFNRIKDIIHAEKLNSDSDTNKKSLNSNLIMNRLKDIIHTEKLNSDTDTNKKSLNSDLIMNRLKDIIHSEKPEYNINKFILMSLKNRTHDLKEVSKFISRFLSDIDNFDCGKHNSEEYLMHFIQEFERLINLYGYSIDHYYSYNMRVRNNRNALEKISTTLMEIRRSCTADLLRALRHKYQLHFFDEEKKKIGFLMVEAITPIEKFVYRTSGIQTHCKIKSFLLLRRSSLQYFRDFFDSFPVDETPLKRSDMNRIDLCIEKIDRDIDNMCKYAEICAYLEDEDEEFYIEDFEEHDDLKEDGASTMPESHVWWAKCSETLNRLRINQFLNQLCYFS
ncbi:uncharacterized protein [Parasteatoda tepidariorum]|uniref:uncharacterized protein n=1 Tax=Parasteatoda tepidariorum TaxID=114398 RepID=UPI001C7192A0|nr:uncharacterized protein LOC107441844 [Parasteatoda tepidariorum]XP_015910721.2 uncharacterized protein LOC107441844 [Parasteatoda tepidariorum]XP_042911912.1 uncharacterized protein LOC107441844 [Parasteatoda tepidariorum]